nr:MAG TPA: Protein of unknown function (DUF4241) [Caudoviricetes sp.]
MKTIILNEQTRITDPCYNKNVSFTAIIPTLPGEYRVVGLNTFEDTTQDVQLLRSAVIYHQSLLKQAQFADTLDMKEIEYGIAVDSGECGVYQDDKYPAEGLKLKNLDGVKGDSRVPDGNWGVTFNHFGGDICPRIYGHQNQDGVYDAIYLDWHFGNRKMDKVVSELVSAIIKVDLK